MTERRIAFYKTQAAIVPQGIVLNNYRQSIRKFKYDDQSKNLDKKGREIMDGFFAAIIERKNVTLKPEYRKQLRFYGITCATRTSTLKDCVTPPIVGLRLEDVISPTGKEETHIYLRTNAREFLLYGLESFEDTTAVLLKKYEKSGKTFADFTDLFSEINEDIPQIRLLL